MTKQAKLYTHVTKGGEYELLGPSQGAGKLKGIPMMIYRDTTSGKIFYREPEEFATRMKAIEPKVDVAALLEQNAEFLTALKAAAKELHEIDDNNAGWGLAGILDLLDGTIAKAGA